MNHNTRNIFEAGISTKTLSILLVISMALTALPIGLIAASDTTSENERTITKNFTFGAPEITEGKISVPGLMTSLGKSGEPDLPVVKTEFYLPLNAKNVQVTTSMDNTLVETKVVGMIDPSPTPIPSAGYEFPILRRLQGLIGQSSSLSKNVDESTMALSTTVYGSGVFYPAERLSYRVGVGRHNGEMYKIVPVVFSPIQYDGIETIKYIAGTVTVTVSYTSTSSTTSALVPPTEKYDLLIITADAYATDLAPLVTHKEANNVKTKLVALKDIYAGMYFPVPTWSHDDQETIKYFIYDAWQNWSVKYVMGVGAYRSFFGLNIPSKQFPIRMSHLEYGEPTYVTDQYYGCIARDDPLAPEGYSFDSWDSNGNGRFAEFDIHGFDYIDPFVDVYFGRLACSNNKEVRTVVDKIITYETNTYGQEWFDNMLSVTGDGFQDQVDLDISWNANSVADGDYTIYAQSYPVDNISLVGPIDEVQVTVDHSAPSRISYTEDDHLFVAPLDEEQETRYPMKPIAEITSVSDNDILGNTNVEFVPAAAYDGAGWTKVDYTSGILKIRGKSYFPTPHQFAWHPETGYPTRPLTSQGSNTNIVVWVNNSDGDTIFGPITKGSQMYWEGEVEGEVGIRYMTGFDATRLWSSNGQWDNMWDLIDEFSKGYGFVYFAGHSNCMVFGDHYPGIPGARKYGMHNAIGALNMAYGLERYQAKEGDPLFPIDQLTNGNKLPVVVMGGCHSAQFDTSLMKLFLDPYNSLFGDAYGTWIPEGMGWWMVRVPQGGAIAFMGFAGLGFGYKGLDNKDGVSGWMNGEFFRNVGKFGIDILGEAFGEAGNNYSTAFNTAFDIGERKTFEEWALLGDPSLKMGGYPPSIGTEEKTLADQPGESPDTSMVSLKTPFKASIEPVFDGANPTSLPLSTSSFKITSNTRLDQTPDLISNGSASKFLVGYSREVPQYSGSEFDAGFAYSNGGVSWVELNKGWPGQQKFVSVDRMGYDYTDNQWNGSYATFGNQGSNTYVMVMPDMTDPSTWDAIHWGEWILHNVGQNGICIASGYPYETVWSEGHWILGMITDVDYDGYKNQVPAFFIPDPVDYGYGSVAWYPGLPGASDMVGVVDPTNEMAYFVCNAGMSGGYRFFGSVSNFPPSSAYNIPAPFDDPDVAAYNGYVYVVYESGSSIYWTNGYSTGSVATGTNPKVVINEDGSVDCYYVHDGNIYVSRSMNHGSTWTALGAVAGVSNVATSAYSPFSVTKDGLVYAATDGDLYSNVFIPTIGVNIGDIVTDNRQVTCTITNAGSINLSYFDWTLDIQGDSPLGQFFGGGPLLSQLFQGRVINGGSASDHVMNLKSGKTIDIVSGPVFGFGHILVTITVQVGDTVLAQTSEDGFLLGGRILLYHGEE